ncbi:MAG: hypothetical protein HQL24_01360 [Candidatus Omnitrophica bacterium]|nr:hypothetical protein [Candidatus Omnitrophota bacterium]
MNDEMNEKPPLGLGEVFKTSFNVYKEHFQSFVSLSLIYALLTLLIRIAIKKILGEAEAESFRALGIIVMLSTLVLCRMGCVMIDMASKNYRKEPLDIRKSFLETKDRYVTYLLVYIGVFFMMAAGLLFFVLPGLYFGAIFFFADTLVILEKKSFGEAFRRSRELVRKQFGMVFLFFLTIILVSLFPVICLQIVGVQYINLIKSLSEVFSTLFIPFYMIAQVQLYHGLIENESGDFI